MSRAAQPGTRTPLGTLKSGTDPLSVHSQPLLRLRPAGCWGHGEPGQELDHSGTSEEVRHRRPHGAEVRDSEPRSASPSVRPARSPAQEPGHLWVQGREWGGSPGLSCPQDPGPSSCESLWRAGKAAFSCPAPTSTTEPACSCWGWAGCGRGAGRLGHRGLGAASTSHPQTEGLFRGQTEAPFTPAQPPLPQRSVCRVSCAARTLPGGSCGGAGECPWAWRKPGLGPASACCSAPVPWDSALPVHSGHSL